MTTTVKERPILFSAPMVKAILDERKTMTRRVVNLKSKVFTFPHIGYKSAWEHPGGGWTFSDATKKPEDWQPQAPSGVQCPYGEVGDRLWVREGAIKIGHERTGKNGQYLWPKFDDEETARNWFDKSCLYTADLKYGDRAFDEPHGTLNKMFMPCWASRITLEVTGVKVERLCDISEVDAFAEGCETTECARCNGTGLELYGEYKGQGCEDCSGQGRHMCRDNFRTLWESIHGKGSWELNPWLWCISFKRVEGTR